MKKNIYFLSLSLSISLSISLALVGCSKSNKSGPAANNGGGGAAAGPVTLKIKWQVGKQYDMSMDMNQLTDVNMPGRPGQTELKITQGFHYAPVKALDNGGAQVRLEFDRQSLTVNQNGKAILSFDSNQAKSADANGPARPVAAAMRAMLGSPLVFTFGPDGKVETIDGLDTLSNNIAAAVPNPMERTGLNQLYNEDTMKRYGSFSETLPDHPVNVGDSWNSTQDVNTPAGTVTVNGTYTFKDWEQRNGHNCVHIVIGGDMKTKTTAAATLGAVVTIKKGTLSGDSWFDPDLGMFVDIHSAEDTALDITTRQGAMTEKLTQNVNISLLNIN